MKPFLAEAHKLKLTAISPIHIGNGDVFDPTEYTIVGNNLYIFDTFQLIKRLSEKDRQKLIEASHDALKLQCFFKEHKKVAIEASHTVVKIVPSIANEFKEKILKTVLNKLEIKAHIRTARQLFLPGSSIKDALKRAFFQHYLNKNDEKDLFSKLKIGDATSDKLSSKVYLVVNKQQNKDDDKSSLSQRLECIEPDSELLTEVTLLKRGENLNIDDEKFRVIVKNFYLPLLKKELDWAKTNEELVPVKVRNRMVKAYNQTIAKKGFVFKVGQHSGAEAMALDGKNASFMGWIYAELVD